MSYEIGNVDYCLMRTLFINTGYKKALDYL